MLRDVPFDSVYWLVLEEESLKDHVEHYYCSGTAAAAASRDIQATEQHRVRAVDDLALDFAQSPLLHLDLLLNDCSLFPQ